MNAMGRPGIMLYFDIREPLSWLPDADKGKLFDAIMEYGEFGVVPEFQGMLAMAWGFIKPKLDKDEESYENAKSQRKYAAWCKKRGSVGLPKIGIEEWLGMDEDERKRRETTDNEAQRPVVPVNGPLNPVNGPLASVNGRYPSTSTTTTTTPTTTTTTTPTASTSSSSSSSTAAAAETDAGAPDEPIEATAAKKIDENENEASGNFGKGIIKLTAAQTRDLCDRMGVNDFSDYCVRLTKFIRENNAHVHNHYETILSWYNQDRKTR